MDEDRPMSVPKGVLSPGTMLVSRLLSHNPYIVLSVHNRTHQSSTLVIYDMLSSEGVVEVLFVLLEGSTDWKVVDT